MNAAGLTQVAALMASGSSPSAIASLTVVGASPLLDATGDYSDATSRIGVNGNGWVAKATMPYLVGQTFDPTKITLTLSDPGYTAGGTTTVTRTVRGGRVLRRQYNVAASNQISNDGVTFTVYFSLIGDNAEFATVYSGTTITAASAAASFYGASASGAIASKTNSSTRAYPKAIPAWINRQHDACGAGGMYVELVAGHYHAMNNQQVARVEFIGTDSSAHTAATQTASAPVLSTLVTKGNPPEVWAATVPVTALTQGDLCFVNYKIYPWIGDSSAVFDSTTDGLNVTGNYTIPDPATSLRFLNDKTGAYTGAHAAVQSGAVGGTVQSSRAAAEATPFPTPHAALAALPAYNNANKGHNDHSGAKIWLLNLTGSPITMDPGDMGSITAGKCLTEIRPSPSNTANFLIALTAGNEGMADKLSWHCDFGAETSLWRGGQFLHYFCDGTYLASTNPVNYESACAGFHNVTFNNWLPDIAGSGADIGELIGCVLTGATVNFESRGRVIIGCSFNRVDVSDFDPSSITGKASQDGKVIYNNTFVNVRANSNLGSASAIGAGYTRGIFYAQNVVERAAASTLAPAVSLFADGNSTAVDNIVVQGNTIVGNRINLLYSDVTAAAGVIKRGSSRFNLFDERNTKSDLFTTNSTATGRVGAWEYVNGVNNWDVVLDGSSGGGDTPADGAWIGEYWPNATYNVTRAAVTFTSDASTNGTQAGGGTYSLTGGSNAAYATVPAGKSPFKYDIAGVIRRTDGTGASGAYERP